VKKKSGIARPFQKGEGKKGKHLPPGGHEEKGKVKKGTRLEGDR